MDICLTMVLHGLPGDNTIQGLYHHCLLQELQGSLCWGPGPPSPFHSFSTPPRPVSLRFSLTPRCQAAFCPFTCLPTASIILAAGLSHALWWVHWIQLEQSVSSTGQPRPLLSEAPTAPHCQCLSTRTDTESIRLNPALHHLSPT